MPTTNPTSIVTRLKPSAGAGAEHLRVETVGAVVIAGAADVPAAVVEAGVGVVEAPVAVVPAADAVVMAAATVVPGTNPFIARNRENQ